MRQDMEELLCERYPLMLSGQRILCGKGWYTLIDTLCQLLQSETDDKQAPQVVAMQVKEKFGVLRFQPRQASSEQRGMIAMAIAMSSHVCELCGQPGQTVVAGAWMTRCPQHAPEGAISTNEFQTRRARQVEHDALPATCHKGENHGVS